MTRDHILCMDLGGTNVRLGLVTSAGQVVRRRRHKMRTLGTKDELYDWLAEIIGAFVAACGRSEKPRVASIGFAGPADSRAGLVYYAPNVACFSNLEVRSNLEERLDLPVVVENDANCAALGEFWRGAGAGAASLFLFTVGTGIGGSFIIGGDVWRGADGIAGEIGHTIVMAGGPRCNCGKAGCLEALVSATAIVGAYRRLAPGRTGRLAVGLAGRAPALLTAKMVFDRARMGDRRAQLVIDASARALGIGIGNVFHLLNPELILIGGGVSRAGQRLIGPAVREARSTIFPPLQSRLRVKRASLGDDAGLLGAAYLGLKMLHA
jgi:glucokinase